MLGGWGWEYGLDCVLGYALVACVSDDESDVVFCREGDSLGYICPLRHVDRIVYIITQSARTRFRRVRITALISVEWCHDG